MTPVDDVRFDSLKLVQDRQTLSGVLAVSGLPRLAESLHEANGNLEYRVEGTLDRRDRPLLRLKVGGIVQLQCQRCLNALEHALAFENAVRLVPAEKLESEYDDDPDEPDCVAASAAFDLASLIEDEVLLALPAYPRHEEGQCTVRATVVTGGKDEAAPGNNVLAFSALKALKPKVIQSKE